ncbi:MAG: hypothetical protein JOZ69_20185, partial [Myxococcales bacterium]|nr:hypothetical protein [Myxococcales bacterium]
MRPPSLRWLCGAVRATWTAVAGASFACGASQSPGGAAGPGATSPAAVSPGAVPGAPAASASASAPPGAAAALPETPDAPFRASPPAAGPDVSWTPPHVESFVLARGVRVLFVPRHDLPIVAVRVV